MKNRRITLILAATAIALAGIVTGLRGSPHTPLHPVADVPVVYAACQPANDTCLNDTTKTSTLTVSYRYPLTTQIEPGSATTWQIVGTWNEDNPDCGTHTETATVDVSWNGSAWVLSNLSLPNDGILDVGICGIQTCQTASGTHSSSYVLKVDLEDPYQGGPFNLRKVVYTTTSVPNGNEINTSPCTLGTSRSPTSQTFSATDEPLWTSGRCQYTCNVGGTSVTITYQ